MSTVASVEMVPMERWGRDHWSLLAYVEDLCVNAPRSVGKMDHRRVRCNGQTHPLLDVNGQPWRPSWGTRLQGFFEFADRSDAAAAEAAGVQLGAHDDWDALDDLAAAGLVEPISLVNGFVTITEKGVRLAGEIRRHKAQGGQMAQFVPEELATAA